MIIKIFHALFQSQNGETGMKRLMMVSTIFFTVLFVAPAWSHHPAEGIVSDEIWQMVDDLLVEADSPHLDLVVDDDMGQQLLVTSIVVETDEADDFMADINEGIDDIISAENNLEMNSVPSDQSTLENNRNSAVSVVREDLGDGTTEISIYEPIGSSQTAPVME